MEKRLFRQKSVERISSPEQLQDYMRVTNPGIWMVLAAVIALLAGLIVASALVTVETTFNAKGRISQIATGILMELPPDGSGQIREGMPVRLAGETGSVDYVFEKDGTLRVTAVLDDPTVALPTGIYDVEIVTESLNPISFLLN